MATTPYNIDAEQEYFEFSVYKHTYKFQHLNSEELAELTTIKDDNIKSMDFLNKFITPVSEGAPAFNEIAKKFIAPNWKKFREMLEAEMGA